jgi:outer membrane protein TolC
VGYFLESVETAAGPQQYKIGLMQKFPFLGKRKLQGKIQASKAETFYFNYVVHQLKLDHAVRSTWYDYYYLAQVTELTVQNFKLIQNWDGVIRSKYVTARTGHPDLIKTQIELIQLEDELSTLENKKIPILERFRTLVNDPSMTDIVVPDSLAFELGKSDKSIIQRQILKNNPNILGVKAAIEMERAKVKRSKLNRMPDFGLGVELIGTGEKDGSSVSGKDPLVAKLSMDIPIWIRKTNSEITSANYTLTGTEARAESIQNELRSELEMVLFDLDESSRQIRLYKDILIPKGLESLSASEIAYRGDKIEFISLVDAQRRLLQFQMKYEKAVVDYLKAKSKLSVLTGEKQS